MKTHLAARLQRGAELVAAAMFAALFGAFLIQIFTRYVLNNPTAWTQELTLVLYIWVVFWTCAFILHERDHISFDLISSSLPPRGRRVLAIASTALVVVAFGIALAPSFDYVSFMRITRTPVLRIPFDVVYSIFIIFLVAVIAAGLLRLARLFGPHWAEEVVPAKPEETGSLL
ncbi:MAG: TRAP transporter small permease [Devosia sp.]